MQIKQRSKKAIVTMVLISGFLIPISSYAASKTFSYNFKHQLTIGSFKASGSKMTIKTNTSTFGGSDAFYIKVYKFGKNVANSTVGMNDDTKTISVKSGETYSVEFWKSSDGNYVKGSGRATY